MTLSSEFLYTVLQENSILLGIFILRLYFFVRHNLPSSMSIWNMKIIWKWVKWKYAANMLDHSRTTIRNLNSWLHISLWQFMILQLLEVEEPKFPLSFLLYLWLVFSLGLPEFLMKGAEISRCFFSASSALPCQIFPKYHHFLFTNIIKHHSYQYSSFTFHI